MGTGNAVGSAVNPPGNAHLLLIVEQPVRPSKPASLHACMYSNLQIIS